MRPRRHDWKVRVKFEVEPRRVTAKLKLMSSTPFGTSPRAVHAGLRRKAVHRHRVLEDLKSIIEGRLTVSRCLQLTSYYIDLLSWVLETWSLA